MIANTFVELEVCESTLRENDHYSDSTVTSSGSHLSYVAFSLRESHIAVDRE
jgi:hypothetical protein